MEEDSLWRKMAAGFTWKAPIFPRRKDFGSHRTSTSARRDGGVREVPGGAGGKIRLLTLARRRKGPCLYRESREDRGRHRLATPTPPRRLWRKQAGPEPGSPAISATGPIPFSRDTGTPFRNSRHGRPYGQHHRGRRPLAGLCS